VISLIDSSTSTLLGLALDATNLRHQVIAHNIANVNTPGYQAFDVRFEQSLRQIRDAIAQGRQDIPRSTGSFQSAFSFVQANAIHHGAVSVDAEIAKLSENTLHQQVLIKALNRHLSIMSMAINEGKR